MREKEYNIDFFGLIAMLLIGYTIWTQPMPFKLIAAILLFTNSEAKLTWKKRSTV